MFDKMLLELPGMKAVLVLLVVSSVVQAALVVGQAVFLALAISNLWAGSGPDAHIPLLASFFACFAIRHVISFAQGELLDRYARKQALALQSRVLALAFDSRASLAYRNGTAATALSVTEGIENVARYIRVLPPKLCAIVGVSVPILIALFAFDWVSGVITLVSFPVIMLFMIVLGKQASARAAKQFAESERLSNHFLDTIRGINSIKALGAGKRAVESVYQASERMRVSTIKTLSVATLSSAVLDLITVFGVAAIAMMLAFRLLDGSIDLFTALTALILAPEFFLPVRSFAADFHASLDGKNALSSVLSILESEPAKPCDVPNSDTVTITNASTFEAREVGYSYTGEDESLHGASFAIAGYVKVGIVGVSGAGKSTLIDLIGGLRQPSEGSFRLNGHPVNLDSEAWKRNVHYIPQHPYVFHASLLDNVRFYCPEASLADVEHAIDSVGLRQLVSELPQGLNTVIGDSGRNLSGGEAQRIALARTMLDGRSVLLYDEPTAHLDIETELELKRHMLACMQGKLVFFATHRLHWLADMDYIVVLENGAVVETGTVQELLSREGALTRLIKAERGCDVA